MASFDITSEAELKTAIRARTQYNESELSADDIEAQIHDAQRDLLLQTGIEEADFYSDRGVTQALLGMACVKSKGAVENSPVVTKNLAGEDVTFRTSDGSSLQVTEYEQMVQQGLANSEAADEAGPKMIRFTRGFLTDSSSAER